MFQHSGKISPVRALSVWAIMHNQATKESWQIMDRWVAELGLEEVLILIKSIIEDNHEDCSELKSGEMQWWRSELNASLN